MPARTKDGFRWDDARVLLALHRTRTLSAAAASLGIDASTVGRRIDALEQSLGARLFDRTPDGAVPTLAADELLPHAEAMELAAMELAGSAEGFERSIEGVVRISVPPGVADLLVVPLLPKLQAKHPGLRIDLDARVGYVDLGRREADLVLRGMRPTQGEVVAVRLASARSIPIAQRAWAERRGNVREPASLPWITYGHDLGHIDDARWVASVAPESAIVLRTSSFSAQIAAVAAGFGVMLVPERLIAARHEFTPLRFTRAAAAQLPPYPEGSLWLAVHRALRGVPRVAAVWDFVIEEVTAELARAGRPSPDHEA